MIEIVQEANIRFYSASKWLKADSLIRQAEIALDTHSIDVVGAHFMGDSAVHHRAIKRLIHARSNTIFAF